MLDQRARTLLLGFAAWLAPLAICAAATLPGFPDLDFDSDGKMRIAFDYGAQLVDRVEDVAVQDDGKIIVVGWAQGGTNVDAVVARVLPDGQLDATFGSGGKIRESFDLGGGNNDFFEAVAIQDDGRIVVAGTVDQPTGETDMIVVRYLETGARDASFGAGGQRIVSFDLGGTKNDQARDVKIAAGRILLAGNAATATSTNYAIARMDFSGALDVGFDVDGKASFSGSTEASLYAIAVGPFGAPIYLVGSSISGLGDRGCFVAVLLWNGLLDPTFAGTGLAQLNPDLGGPDDDHCVDVAIQPDGKLIFAMSSTTDSSGNRDIVLRRTFPNGNLDGAFNVLGEVQIGFDLGTAGNENDSLRGIALAANGEIVVGATVDVAASERVFGFKRVTPAGAIDSGFGVGGTMIISFDAQAEDDDDMAAITLAPDGRIVAAGAVDVSDSNLDIDFGLARLTNDFIFADGFDWDGSTEAWSSTVP